MNRRRAQPTDQRWLQCPSLNLWPRLPLNHPSMPDRLVPFHPILAPLTERDADTPLPAAVGEQQRRLHTDFLLHAFQAVVDECVAPGVLQLIRSQGSTITRIMGMGGGH